MEHRVQVPFEAIAESVDSLVEVVRILDSGGVDE